MSKKVNCPICLSTKQFMEARETKGFVYKDCNFCDKKGKVSQELFDDYALSQDENTIDYEDY